MDVFLGSVMPQYKVFSGRLSVSGSQKPWSCGTCWTKEGFIIVGRFLKIGHIDMKDYETYYRGEEKQTYCKSIRDNLFQFSH